MKRVYFEPDDFVTEMKNMYVIDFLAIEAQIEKRNNRIIKIWPEIAYHI
jgi:hypothetical protein